MQSVERKQEIRELLAEFKGTFVANQNPSGWAFVEIDKEKLVEKMKHHPFQYEFVTDGKNFTSLCVDFQRESTFDIGVDTYYPKDSIYELYFPRYFMLSLLEHEVFTASEEEIRKGWTPEVKREEAYKGARRMRIYEDYQKNPQDFR